MIRRCHMCLVVRLELGLLLALTLGVSAARAQAPVEAAVEVSRTNVFVGEPLDLTLVIRSRNVGVANEIGLRGLPDPSVMELGRFQELEPKRNLQNREFAEERRFRSRARMLRAARLDIAPVLQVSTVHGGFGFRFMQGPYDVPVVPVTLTAREIPTTGRPSDFSGAVGQLSIQVQAAPLDVAVGDLVTLTMRIVGTGDLDRVSAPRVEVGPQFKAYEMKEVPPRPGETERVFEQIVVPQSTNATVLPPISFTYFDTASGTYRKETRGPFALTFHGRTQTKTETYRPKDIPKKAVATPGVGEGGSGLSLARHRSATLKAGTPALFAPDGRAMVLFDVPENAAIAVVERMEGWAKIEYENKRGWVPVGLLR